MATFAARRLQPMIAQHRAHPRHRAAGGGAGHRVPAPAAQLAGAGAGARAAARAVRRRCRPTATWRRTSSARRRSCAAARWRASCAPLPACRRSGTRREPPHERRVATSKRAGPKAWKPVNRGGWGTERIGYKSRLVARSLRCRRISARGRRRAWSTPWIASPISKRTFRPHPRRIAEPPRALRALAKASIDVRAVRAERDLAGLVLRPGARARASR